MSKTKKTGLTRLREKKAVEARDPDVYEIMKRLRAVQTDLYEIRIVAARNRQRWPQMESQLRRASLYILAQLMTAEVACDPFDDV